MCKGVVHPASGSRDEQASLPGAQSSLGTIGAATATLPERRLGLFAMVDCGDAKGALAVVISCLLLSNWLADSPETAARQTKSATLCVKKASPRAVAPPSHQEADPNNVDCIYVQDALRWRHKLEVDELCSRPQLQISRDWGGRDTAPRRQAVRLNAIMQIRGQFRLAARIGTFTTHITGVASPRSLRPWWAETCRAPRPARC